MECINKINSLITEETKTTVGILCRKIELLEETDSLKPDLLKELVKDVINEQARTLKKLIRASFIPSVKFISNDNPDK